MSTRAGAVDGSVLTESGADRKRPARLRRFILDRWAMVAAVATLLLLTLTRIGVRDVWADEALSVGSVEQLSEAMHRIGGTMVLYYVLISPLVSLTHDPVWLRLPSVLFVAGAICVVWEVGRRTASTSVAGLASVGLALSWFAARYAMEMRGYALALLLVCLGWLGIVSAVRAGPTGRYRRWWALFTVSMFLAPLAHGISALQLPVQIACLLFAPPKRFWLRRLPMVVVPVVLELALLESWGASDVASWVQPLSLGQIQGVVAHLVGTDLWRVLIVGSAIAAGAVVSVQRVWQQAWHRPLPGVGPGGVGCRSACPVVGHLGLPPVPGRPLHAHRPPRGGPDDGGGHSARVPRPSWRVATGALVAFTLFSNQGEAVRSTEPWGKLTVAGRGAGPPRRWAHRQMHRAGHRSICRGPSQPRPTEARAPLSLPDEVGEVRRFYPQTGRDGSGPRDALLAADNDTIWWIDRGGGESPVDDRGAGRTGSSAPLPPGGTPPLGGHRRHPSRERQRGLRRISGWSVCDRSAVSPRYVPGRCRSPFVACCTGHPPAPIARSIFLRRRSPTGLGRMGRPRWPPGVGLPRHTQQPPRLRAARCGRSSPFGVQARWLRIAPASVESSPATGKRTLLGWADDVTALADHLGTRSVRRPRVLRWRTVRIRLRVQSSVRQGRSWWWAPAPPPPSIVPGGRTGMSLDDRMLTARSRFARSTGLAKVPGSE